MERVLAHLKAHALIYSIIAVSVFILILVLINVQTYQIQLIRNYFRSFFTRKETFQNQDVVAGGAQVPDSVSRDHCKILKEHIDNYEKVKIQHKGVPIENLDETLRFMKEQFVSFNCE